MPYNRRNDHVTRIRNERSTATTLLLYGSVILGLLALGWLAVNHVPAISQQYNKITGRTAAGDTAGAQRSVGKKVGGMWRGVGK